MAYVIRGCIFFATAVGDAGTRLKKKPEHRVEKLHPRVCLHQSAVAAACRSRGRGFCHCYYLVCVVT